ncbi:hypothetical protein ACJ7V3_16440 [Halomonas elongata]|uniref:hypothetical protein n=1 Tax=Halomonas elongata TaxID=2746 RepID=UPI0038D4207D
MSYTPTADDLLYILESDGERFSAPDRRQLESEIHKALQRRQDNAASGLEETVMRAWADRWVAEGGNGGQPLTESPLPPSPGDGEIFDPDFAAACVECKANEPCCLVSGSVTDSTDDTRQITWPPADIEVDGECRKATTLLVVAKEVEGRHLSAKVKAEWDKPTCQVGHLDRPSLTTSGLTEGQQRLDTTPSEVALGYPQFLNMSLALKNYVPENVLHAVFAMDAILAFQSTLQGGDGARFTPNQCVTDHAMGQTLRVIALPYVNLKGKLEMASRLVFSTAGISANADTKGTLEGQFGPYELTSTQLAEYTANTGQALEDGNQAPGLIGTMASIIKTLDHFVADGNTQDQSSPDRTQYATRIVLSQSLTFQPEGVELTPVKSSPDLQLEIGGLTSTFELGVTGRLDFIDVLAMALSAGAGATAVREARARMAAGEYVNATLQAYLELGAKGSLTHGINSGATFLLPAHGDPDAALEGLEQDFEGALKISGKAEIAIEVEARVWVITAKAGVSGSLHTSWTWTVRLQDGERQRRQDFEGVKVIYKAEGKIVVESSDGDAKQNGPELSGEASEEQQWNDLFERVDQDIESSRQSAGEMNRERGENDLGAEGDHDEEHTGRWEEMRRVMRNSRGESDAKELDIWEPREGTWQTY